MKDYDKIYKPDILFELPTLSAKTERHKTSKDRRKFQNQAFKMMEKVKDFILSTSSKIRSSMHPQNFWMKSGSPKTHQKINRQKSNDFKESSFLPIYKSSCRITGKADDENQVMLPLSRADCCHNSLSPLINAFLTNNLSSASSVVKSSNLHCVYNSNQFKLAPMFFKLAVMLMIFCAASASPIGKGQTSDILTHSLHQSHDIEISAARGWTSEAQEDAAYSEENPILRKILEKIIIRKRRTIKCSENIKEIEKLASWAIKQGVMGREQQKRSAYSNHLRASVTEAKELRQMHDRVKLIDCIMQNHLTVFGDRKNGIIASLRSMLILFRQELNAKHVTFGDQCPTNAPSYPGRSAESSIINHLHEIRLRLKGICRA